MEHAEDAPAQSDREIPRDTAMTDDVVVYYKPGCPFAIRLHAALTPNVSRSVRSASGTTNEQRRKGARAKPWQRDIPHRARARTVVDESEREGVCSAAEVADG